MQQMTPRERVLAAINHQQPDCLPIELGSTRASGIHTIAYERLKAHLGLPPAGETDVRFSQVTLPSEGILRRFGVDTRPIMVGSPENFRDVERPDGSWEDEWGVPRVKRGGSLYYDVVKPPLESEGLTVADLRRHRWPDPDDPGRVRGIADRHRYLRERTDYAVLLHLGAELALQTQYLRGLKHWFTDLLLQPDFANTLLDIVLDYQLQYTKNVLDALPADVDIIYVVDDIASQEGLMISPQLYRSYLRPRQERLFGYIKSRSGAKLLFHECGSIVDIMEDLIEIGVDAINPVQLRARGMDAEALKSRFGDRLAFWGGIDGQQMLPYGTRQDIVREVRHLERILGEGGGFILGPCHNIQPDVPPENICAMYEAALAPRSHDTSSSPILHS